MDREPRDFGRHELLQRAAQYINRAENALAASDGTKAERHEDADRYDFHGFAAAAASVAAALIAYAEADGPSEPNLR